MTPEISDRLAAVNDRLGGDFATHDGTLKTPHTDKFVYVDMVFIALTNEEANAAAAKKLLKRLYRIDRGFVMDHMRPNAKKSLGDSEFAKKFFRQMDRSTNGILINLLQDQNEFVRDAFRLYGRTRFISDVPVEHVATIPGLKVRMLRKVCDLVPGAAQFLKDIEDPVTQNALCDWCEDHDVNIRHLSDKLYVFSIT